MFHGEKKDVKKSCAIDKKKGADQISAEEKKHEKPSERIDSQEKFYNGYGIQGNIITFIFPSVLPPLYSIFRRADKTTFYSE
jgi:hypothetical protein